MANHKSAKKRARQTPKRTLANKIRKSRVKTYVKKLKAAIESKNKETTQELLKTVRSLYARLGKTSAVNKKTAARYVSRIAQQANKI